MKNKLDCFIAGLLLMVVQLSAQVKLPDNILSTLKPTHPRLLVGSLQDFEQINLRAASDTFILSCKNNVLHQADSILTVPVCTYDIPDGLRLLVMSRIVLNRSYVLSMAYRLTKEQKYVDRLWQDLLAASQFPDWNPRHFLDVGEMTHAFAIGYDWLFDQWTIQQKQVIKQAIMEKGLLRAKLYYDRLIAPGTYSVDFPRTTSNWNSVCNAGVSIGALAIAESEPPLANEIIKNAITSIPIALKEFAPDGGFTEGPSYWGYAMKYNVSMMACLESALGNDFGLSQSAGINTTANFPIAMNGATGNPYQYADAWPTIVNSPIFFWLAKKFNNQLYADYLQPISERSVMDAIWYNQNKLASVALPLDNRFTRVNVASLRSAWNDKNAWYVGIKGGYNQDSHCHLDLGSFILERNNVRWLVDLGVDSYDLPGYFDKKFQRWTYYRTRAEGHNTLVINPDKNPDQALFARAAITQFQSSDSKSFALINLSEAYKGKVSTAQRGIALLNKSAVLVQDEIKANKAFEMYWFVHTYANISLSPEKNTATLEVDGKKMLAQIISPVGASFEVMDAALLSSSIASKGNNPNKGFKKLAIHLKGATNTTVAVVFKEMEGTENPDIVPLAKW